MPADLTGYASLLIYGGTFDPPHRAHIDIPEAVRILLDIDVVVYVPAAQSPHKPDAPPTDPYLRLLMLGYAIAGDVHAVIDDCELFRPPPSYTVDTLEDIHARTAPDATLRLLIGSDQARAFDHWHEHDRIAELAEPVVMLRPPDTAESIAADLGPTWAKRLAPVDPMPHSSTEVRRRAAAGEPLDDLVDPHVAHLIHKHKLYR